MDFTTDVHVEAANIQEQIEEHLGLRGKGLVFEFSRDKEHIKLDLITVSPRHNQSFLFHSVIGFDKIDALKRMFAYVKRYREEESSYTIQWTAGDDQELHTSYFSARHIHDALDKLYYGRDMHTLTVFSVVLNPVT